MSDRIRIVEETVMRNAPHAAALCRWRIVARGNDFGYEAAAVPVCSLQLRRTHRFSCTVYIGGIALPDDGHPDLRRAFQQLSLQSTWLYSDVARYGARMSCCGHDAGS